MEILAIIPARGGSKGIPKKNLSLLAGEPLIVHTIRQALQTVSINRVVVSTDDFEIQQVAQSAGAEVVLRPKEISHGTATSESALIHTLDYLRGREEYEPDLVVFLQATSPLRQRNDIQNAVDTLVKEGADSLFSACPVHSFFWRNEGSKGFKAMNYDYKNRSPRQQCPEDLIENGSIYVFRTNVIKKFNNRLGGKISTYRMREIDSFQIDTVEDLELVEQLMAYSNSKPELLILKDIRLLVLDFDGVMTDNRVLVNQDGQESVWCHRGDGWGISKLKRAGIKVIVISTETNSVISVRCQKLGIECIQKCKDKKKALEAIIKENSLKPQEVAYLGNDTNDIEAMKYVGVAVAVSDAVPQILKIAHLITSRKGGFGAVREAADWILAARGEK